MLEMPGAFLLALTLALHVRCAGDDAKRPWLGVNSLEEDGRIKVMQVNEESPAAQAGIGSGRKPMK